MCEARHGGKMILQQVSQVTTCLLIFLCSLCNVGSVLQSQCRCKLSSAVLAVQDFRDQSRLCRDVLLAMREVFYQVHAMKTCLSSPCCRRTSDTCLIYVQTGYYRPYHAENSSSSSCCYLFFVQSRVIYRQSMQYSGRYMKSLSCRGIYQAIYTSRGSYELSMLCSVITEETLLEEPMVVEKSMGKRKRGATLILPHPALRVRLWQGWAGINPAT